MKYIKCILLIILLFTINHSIFANPISFDFISEFKIDSSGWKLEMVDRYNIFNDGYSLDGCILESLADTAYFKDGLIIDTTYRIFDQSSLKDTLYINPEGDKIRLRYYYGGFIDYLNFGNVDGSQIIAPEDNQSICRHTNMAYMNYLDNTPTLGSKNDSLNAIGYLDILVTDLYDIPIPNFEIMHDWGFYYSQYINGADSIIITDQNGTYLFKYYAQRQFLYVDPLEIICHKQILPEDTVAVTMKIDTNISAICITENMKPSQYLLNQNYPNPFNNSTHIAFYLPQDENIDITIYDINGKKVQTLYNGHRSRGAHILQWDAGVLASGLYIYRLKTKNTTLSRKCMIIK